MSANTIRIAIDDIARPLVIIGHADVVLIASFHKSTSLIAIRFVFDDIARPLVIIGHADVIIGHADVVLIAFFTDPRH